MQLPDVHKDVCEWLIVIVSSLTVWHPPGVYTRAIIVLDLPNCLSYSIHRMYADDTNLTFTNDDINKLDNATASDLICVNTWLNATN